MAKPDHTGQEAPFPVLASPPADGPSAEHPLPPLARHGPLRPAVRAPDPDAEHPTARRPGRALPRRPLRGADLLGKPSLSAHRAVRPLERDARPGPPRVGAERLHGAHRPHPPWRGLLVGPDR